MNSMNHDPARAVIDARPELQSQTPRRNQMELEDTLDHTAERIVECGTHTEARTLQAIAAATRDMCPGAAAALVDWDGSEIARLRAFGIVHGVVLGALGHRDRLWLHDEMLGIAEAAFAG